ncbi:MAG: XTP/dITP diphosphatase [Clostridia bacterium]
MNKIVFATHNKNKVAELTSMLPAKSWSVQAASDFPELEDVEETGNSFAENALLKARYVTKMLGQIAIADDSGLTVEYLKGAPGIYSARYAGETKNDQANNKKLIKALVGIENRVAAFCCAIAITYPNGKEFVVEGSCPGIIGLEARGNNGFGYDPLFYLPEMGKTMAELTMEEKNKISHRAKAFSLALKVLQREEEIVKLHRL